MAVQIQHAARITHHEICILRRSGRVDRRAGREFVKQRVGRCGSSELDRAAIKRSGAGIAVAIGSAQNEAAVACLGEATRGRADCASQRRIDGQSLCRTVSADQEFTAARGIEHACAADAVALGGKDAAAVNREVDISVERDVGRGIEGQRVDAGGLEAGRNRIHQSTRCD